MPGHRVSRSIFKDQDQYDRLCCIKCHLLLKDVVQPSCGHCLCQSCADTILQNENPPLCPHQDCREEFIAEDGVHYFPDRFIRKEIQNLEVSCTFSIQGCDWEGKFGSLKAHLKTCPYKVSYDCEHCGKPRNYRSKKDLEKHEAECKNSQQECPLVKLGCQHTHQMSKEELDEHISTNQLEHLTLIADKMIALESKLKPPDGDEPHKKPQHVWIILQSDVDVDCDIAKSNFDGTMIWKIPQFSQHVSNAQNGKHTSISCPCPFNISRYGFKLINSAYGRKPPLQFSISNVIRCIKSVNEYYQLGSELEVEASVLKRIEHDFPPPSTQRRLSAVIEHWIRNDLGASWEKLAVALDKIDYKVLADQIRSANC